MTEEEKWKALFALLASALGLVVAILALIAVSQYEFTPGELMDMAIFSVLLAIAVGQRM